MINDERWMRGKGIGGESCQGFNSGVLRGSAWFGSASGR